MAEDQLRPGPEDRNELEEPVWAVVSFEKAEAMNLVYQEAVAKLRELEEQGIPGLCVVTNRAAMNMEAV